MGLSVRDDPRKEVDIAGRTWGEAVGGVALSLMRKPVEDADELPVVSAAIHNRSQSPVTFTTRGWLNFFEVSVAGTDGAAAELTPFGRESMKTERLPAASAVTLPPGEALEADIPIGALYRLGRENSVQVSAVLPTGQAFSNEIQLHR